MKWRVTGALTVAAALAVTMLPASGAASGTTLAEAPRHGAKPAKHHHKRAYSPPTGPIFNDPYGGDEARFRIERHILAAIRNTPKKGHIRIALYSFDRVPLAKALVAARKRGVQVQVLLNDHQVTRAQRILHKGLGHNPKKDNFAYECQASCRGRRDNLHSKFYLFDRSGKANDVVMFGSANLTLNAVKWQWNDLYTVNGQTNLFNNFTRLFNKMRHDYSHNKPYYTFCNMPRTKTCHLKADNYFTQVFPEKVTAKHDPVLTILNNVQCTYQSHGHTQHTKVRLSMHTMQGDRGEYIAAKIRTLWANGCDIKVLYGLIGYYVKQTIGAPTARGRIPLRSMGYDYNDDGLEDRYTHQKYVTINGRWADSNVALVFTGSSNWTSRGTYGDEIMVKVEGPGNVAQWNGNWDFMWNTHSRDAYTTTSSNYKVVVPTVDENGMPTFKTVTKQIRIVRVLPDHLHKGGPHFEND